MSLIDLLGHSRLINQGKIEHALEGFKAKEERIQRALAARRAARGTSGLPRNDRSKRN